MPKSDEVGRRHADARMLTGSASVDLEVDDYVFLRPTQSEFVMLQFGEIVVVRGARYVDSWAPLPQGG